MNPGIEDPREPGDEELLAKAWEDKDLRDEWTENEDYEPWR